MSLRRFRGRQRHVADRKKQSSAVLQLQETVFLVPFGPVLLEKEESLSCLCQDGPEDVLSISQYLEQSDE